MKYLLLVGNFSFHHLEDEEMALFTTGNEHIALAHEVDSYQLYDDKEEAYQNGDDAESYVLFPDFNGELVFENDEDRLKAIKEVGSLMPIESVKEYSESLFNALKL